MDFTRGFLCALLKQSAVIDNNRKEIGMSNIVRALFCFVISISEGGRVQNRSAQNPGNVLNKCFLASLTGSSKICTKNPIHSLHSSMVIVRGGRFYII